MLRVPFLKNGFTSRALWERYRSLILYGLIGLTGAFLDMFIFIVLTTKLDLFYQFSNLLSVTVGISNNFFWNARFNFKKWDSLLVRFLSFYMIGIIGLLISAGLLFYLRRASPRACCSVKSNDIHLCCPLSVCPQ